MKKYTSIFALFCVIALLFAGCSSGGGGGDPNTTDQGKGSNPKTPAMLYQNGSWANEIGTPDPQGKKCNFNASTLSFKYAEGDREDAEFGVTFANLTDASSYTKLIVWVVDNSDDGYNAPVSGGGLFFAEDAEGWIDFDDKVANPLNGGQFTFTFAEGEMDEDDDTTINAALKEFCGFWIYGMGWGTWDKDWKVKAIWLE